MSSVVNTEAPNHRKALNNGKPRCPRKMHADGGAIVDRLFLNKAMSGESVHKAAA